MMSPVAIAARAASSVPGFSSQSAAAWKLTYTPGQVRSNRSWAR
jgi:hypothetical protein